MVQFKVEDKSYNMPTSWQEVSMKTFIRFQKVIELNSTMPLGDEMLLQQLFEALCDVEQGTFDEISYGTVLMLNPHLEGFNKEFPKSEKKIWEFNDTIYTYNVDPNKYTLADFADIKTMQANSKQNLDYLAEIAAIMIRPAIKCLDEAGNEYYRLAKRSKPGNIGDAVANMLEQSHNKEVILKMNCVDVMTVCNFFLSTMNG